MNTPPPGIEALPNGQWVVAGDTHLGLWAKQKNNIVTDPHVFLFLRPYLEDVEVVFDVGANIGDHTRAYLDMGKKVIAFEPHPLSVQCLWHNCIEAIIFEGALSDQAGELSFMGLDNVGASRIRPDGEMKIRAARLDDLALPAPQFVKIDVEGHEPKVLKGMMETLRQHRPLVFIEVNAGALADNGFSAEDIRKVFDDLGYLHSRFYPVHAQPDWPQYDLLFIP